MQILINTDHNIDGHDGLAEHVRGVVEDSLSRFSSRVTRVEVHLSDQNAAKSGPDDKRCMMEARLEHHSPTAVTHLASSVHEAVNGAADKLKRAVEHLVGKLHAQ